MRGKEEKSLDIFGVKPVGDAINTITKGVSALLGKICQPAAEEFGLLLKDRVSYWRLKNLANIAEKAEKRFKIHSRNLDKKAHPRIIHSIIEHASWNETDEIQEMWAGLIASSCTEDGNDDSNLIFVNLLAQLTTIQARIINHACTKAEKEVTKSGFIQSSLGLVSLEDLIEISGINDKHRLDRELDHLVSLNLLRFNSGGFDRKFEVADITPTPLALNLFVRCNGSLESPIQFFGLTPKTDR